MALFIAVAASCWPIRILSHSAVLGHENVISAGVSLARLTTAAAAAAGAWSLRGRCLRGFCTAAEHRRAACHQAMCDEHEGMRNTQRREQHGADRCNY